MKKIKINDQLNFLNDLDNLSDEDENYDDDIFKREDIKQGREFNKNRTSSESLNEQQTNSSLLKCGDFLEILGKIENESSELEHESNSMIMTKDSQLYTLISKLNEYILVINKEISILNKELRELYSERFPELSSIIFNPYEYAMTVKYLANDLNVSKIDISYLPSNVQLTLNIMSSSTTGKPLNKSKLDLVISICDDVYKLSNYKKKIMSYIEHKMIILCPNLSALVGSTIASKLVTAAGGIVELAKMPSNNVLVMGAQRVNLEGFSSAGKLHMGYLSELEEVKKIPEKHKMQMLRKYSGKTVLMARIDAYRLPKISEDLDLDNKEKVITEKIKPPVGDKFREEINKIMNKIIEPSQAVIKKPLPRPDDKPRRKRGGKRMRSIKERYAQTEMRLMKNRMKFGPDAQIEYRETGKGLGLLGVGGTGAKLKASAKVQKINTKKQKMLALESSQNSNDKGLASGLHSKVVFTPVEGIELINPELLEKRYANVAEKYFSSTSGFSTVVNQKKKGSNTLYEI